MKQKVILGISILAGLLAAVITRAYLAGKDAQYEQMKKNFTNKYGVMEVVCYAKDVPAGTPLSKSDIGSKTVPRMGIEGKAVTAEEYELLLDRRTLAPHSRGNVVFWSDIKGGNPNSSSLSASIEKNWRAYSINVSGAAAVSGMVRPNDHVDVIGTFTFPGKSADGAAHNDTATFTLLQNVLVLATGRETAKSLRPQTYGASQASAGYSTVTLQVTPREVEILAFTDQMRGRLSLSLRNPANTRTEDELPTVDFKKIRSEIEQLNKQRKREMGGR